MGLSKENKETLREEETQVCGETAETEEKADKVQTLMDEVKTWEDKYMRLAAEYDNYQKRTQREKDALYADAVIDTAAQILSIEDNLERALAVEVESEDARKVLDGVLMVSKQMKEILNKLDITEIEAVGKEFDPRLHNAVMHIEDDTVAENTIIEEFMKGYIYKGDRVVRHSMVKVAN